MSKTDHDTRLHNSLVMIDRLLGQLMTLEGCAADNPENMTPLIEEAGAWLERAEMEEWK
jgi:hypothetical protein